MKRPAIEAYRQPAYWVLALVAMRLGIMPRKKRRPAAAEKQTELEMKGHDA